LGDTSHPIEAIGGSGLAIGSYKAPQALFIADTTGNVGIGTTTPTAGILNAVANSNSVVGFSVVGWNSTVNSGTGNGKDAIRATGGNGNIPADYGSRGRLCWGIRAQDYVSGPAIVAQGGGLGGCCGDDGVVATGGIGYDYPGFGVVATGGPGFAAGAGVLAFGGNTNSALPREALAWLGMVITVELTAEGTELMRWPVPGVNP
jgi:hypothetical protein